MTELRIKLKKILTDLEYSHDYLFTHDEIPNIIDKIEEAISVTRCCTELKEKKVPTFDEWLKKLKWKQIGSSYTFKRGESYTDAESLLISYKKEYYNL